ncbi:MAG: c-type cytochrome domain-containing protein [Alphaproteobacteria bacterium]|jgi:hypothetical protein|nr:c-type cytochrome domain-containing protein [Alphaproteobacteria bacterium]MDP6814300.1 c-type cytochrome domain-containing protein [Alphaproteobacteria bacterium]
MLYRCHFRLPLALGFLGGLLFAVMWPQAAPAQQALSFKEDVFPILQIRCVDCHQPGGKGYQESGLDLQTYEGLMKGTKHGAIVVAGSAFTSNLVAVIDRRTDRKIWMPHGKKKLSKCERQSIRFWINQGARNN